MQTDGTNRVVAAHFAALSTGRFKQFFTDDVTWTTMQNNAEVSGARAVEEAITGLHARMSDLRTCQLSVTDGTAHIEGSCASVDSARIPYCVAYEVVGDRIAAMRAYGEIAALMPTAD